MGKKQGVAGFYADYTLKDKFLQRQCLFWVQDVVDTLHRIL